MSNDNGFGVGIFVVLFIFAIAFVVKQLGI